MERNGVHEIVHLIGNQEFIGVHSHGKFMNFINLNHFAVDNRSWEDWDDDQQ